MAFHSWYEDVRPDVTCRDFDGDGDLDCIVAVMRGDAGGGWQGDAWGLIDPIYYENTGDASRPFWVPVGNQCTRWRDHEQFDSFKFQRCMSSGGSPLRDLNLPEGGPFYVRSECQDFDGDGDLDCVWGTERNGFVYLKNTGSRNAPSFQVAADNENPFETFRIEVQDQFYAGSGPEDRETKKRSGSWNTPDPVCRDFDSDGDIDCLIFNSQDGDSLYAENIGSATNPVFREANTNPFFGGKIIGQYSQVEAGDINGDGLDDLVLRHWKELQEDGKPYQSYGRKNWYCLNKGSPSGPNWPDCEMGYSSGILADDRPRDPDWIPYRRVHPLWGFHETKSCRHFELGDFNGDGKVDYLEIDMCDTRSMFRKDPMQLYYNIGPDDRTVLTKVPNNCPKWGKHLGNDAV